MTVPHTVLQRKCACGGSAGLTGACSKCNSERLRGKPLQTKLRVNEPGDEYEQEADRMAAQVMQEMEPGFKPGPSQSHATVQRRFADDSGGFKDAKFPVIQRQEGAAGGLQSAESVQQTEGGEAKEEESPCPSWFQDPQSLS
jgi:hypothetical protein